MVKPSVNSLLRIVFLAEGDDEDGYAKLDRGPLCSPQHHELEVAPLRPRRQRRVILRLPVHGERR